MANPTLDRARTLYDLADTQAGYFTAGQALTLGYRYPQQHHHVRQGTWQRVGHGLFRLSAYPFTSHEQLAQLALWSRDRQGRTATVSHETALAFYQLSDVLPAAIHLTVPAGFQKSAPPGVVLHRRPLPPEDVQTQHGFTVTTVQRTLLDLAPELAPDLLEQALGSALDGGWISAGQASAVRQGAGHRR